MGMLPRTFVHQLHAILAEPSVKDLIGWDTERDDDSFYLRPYHQDFPEQVLKRYFKHGNISSFVRQLHMYGFHKLPNTATNKSIQNAIAKNTSNSKIPKSEIIWYFTHLSGYFTKDANREILARITRKTTGLGKDGKRRNILSPVCVNFIDSNGTAIYPPRSDLYPQNIDINNYTKSRMELGMSNQFNYMNRPYERSISCVNMPVNRVRTPVTRTNSQPVIRLRQTSMTPIEEQLPNNGQRLSYSSIDSNATYYNTSSNNLYAANPVMNIQNNGNPQYHLQQPQSLPLPIAPNTGIPSSVMSFPYMNSITPPPPAAMGYVQQPSFHSSQQQQQQQPMFKQSVFNNNDHSPLTVDDGVTPQITRPSSISKGNGQLPSLDPLMRNEMNVGPAMMSSLPAPPLLPIPQHPTATSLNVPKNDDNQPKIWNQQRMTPNHLNGEVSSKNEQPALPRMSLSSLNGAAPTSNPDTSFRRISTIMKETNNTTPANSEKDVAAELEANFQNLVKSIVLITGILEKLHISNGYFKSGVDVAASINKARSIMEPQLQMDQLLDMLSHLQTQLINNSDIIMKAMGSSKQPSESIVTTDNSS